MHFSHAAESVASVYSINNLPIIKDIMVFEQIQWHATKFILDDFTSDYKSRLTTLKLLSLMYWLELQDIMFLVSYLKNQSQPDCGTAHLILYNHVHLTPDPLLTVS